MATNGLVLIKPTTVDKTGASSTATINTKGSVTFTSCESLSLNGVFSSTYDNYIINIISHDVNSDGVSLFMRLRLSGTDNSTASSYVRQRLSAASTTVSGVRTTANSAEIHIYGKNTTRNGIDVFVYGPNLAQPTAVRAITSSSETAASLYDTAFTHNQSTGYDGFTVFTGAGPVTGLVKVYGLVK